MRMCDALAQLGHELQLFAFRGPFSHDPVDFYGLHKSFTIHFSRKHRGSVHRELRAVSAALRAKAARVRLGIARDIRCAFFATLLRIPTIVELHSPVRYEKRSVNAMFRRIIHTRHLVGLVVITQALADDIAHEFPALIGRMHVLADAANPPSLPPEPSVDNSDSALKVGFVGSLNEGKGMHMIRELVPLCPNCHFYVVGGSSAEVSYWRDQLSMYPNVTFLGRVDPREVEAQIRTFDVCLLPNGSRVLSRGGRDIGRWTSPMKLFEYMAAARPVVASDLPVLREVLEHGRNALLCSPDDPQQWAEALSMLRADQHLRQAISQQAHQDVICRHNWLTRAESMLTIHSQRYRSAQ